MSNVAKNCDILATSLSVLHNYFNSSTIKNYFSDLYPATILDLSVKLFFPCFNTQLILLLNNTGET